MGKVITIGNKKGGVGKTTTVINLGVALTEKGKKVCLIDLDPQGNLTTGLGLEKNLPETITTVLEYAVKGREYDPEEPIQHVPEGVDVIAADKVLSGLEMYLMSFDDKEILKRYVERIKEKYDFIIIDCGPALGPLMINALTAADRVIIPVEMQPYGTEGLQDMLGVVCNVNKKLNPKLKISILYAIDDAQTRQSKDIKVEIEEAYGGHLHIMQESIPRRNAISAAPGYGMSFFRYVKEIEKKRKKELQPILERYRNLACEVIQMM